LTKHELHPRNRHRGRYDFPRLIQASAELGPFVAPNKYGDLSIDFADVRAVKALNRAILKLFYDINDWDIPDGYLCPPIPGRADYIHHVADLLADAKKPGIRVLDIGTGANVIYPLIGHREYGWAFVGTETDRGALESAQAILEKNPSFGEAIELREQKSRESVFQGIIRPGDRFDLTTCNPPFHASAAEARAGTERKWRGLRKAPAKKPSAKLNFGGKDAELWCPGGELAFVLRMIAESAAFAGQCGWFTALVSKESNLPEIGRALEAAKVQDRRILEMAQGQKRSRIAAWTFTRLSPSITGA
jgi:23S rRNA (adenine1618-N6)-methyltransferase